MNSKAKLTLLLVKQIRSLILSINENYIDHRTLKRQVYV